MPARFIRHVVFLDHQSWKHLAKDKTEVDQLHSASDNWVQLMEGEIFFCDHVGESSADSV